MFVDGNHKLFDLVKRSADAGLVCDDPSRAVQADMVDADINVIVKRFGLTGTLPQSLRMPEYADYDAIFDFQSAQAVILQAQEQFMTIPADIRARFENSPQLFTEFVLDPKNVEETVRLGLAVARPPKVEEPPPST